MRRAPTSAQRGALLLAAAGILVIAGLAAFAVFSFKHQSRELAVGAAPALRLARLDSALAAFVARNRRLPCPARGILASGVSGAGTESINLTSGACVPANQADGVVPWTSLGLSEADALDPWNARISYRVQPSLASNTLLLMNMSWCDPLGNATSASGASLACTANCTGTACMNPRNYLYNKGLQVKDGAGAWLNQPAPTWPSAPTPPPPVASGAAYVLVVHGINGAGAYNSTGTLQGGSPAPGSKEAANLNGLALTGATVFVDSERNLGPLPVYYDDVLSHPTISDVLAAAALGPRSPH